MFLGIEIGGTKLQLGVGRGDGTPLATLQRLEVNVRDGAAGIRRQIEEAGRRLIARHGLRAIGVGFGGPVEAAAGRTIKSHQIEGWDDFPLADWCRQALALPAAICNDADAAGLAEARFGAGRGQRVVFYITVGSGIGGALMIDGKVYGGSSGVAAELGHLRPGLQADRPAMTVEAAASGWGIAAAARAALAAGTDPSAAELLARADGHADRLTCQLLAQAASEGNPLARQVFRRAVQTLGWAIAQMITLMAPGVVVLGGGVPQAGEALFFAPLRAEVERYVFPPLRDRYRIVPAALGEAVVLHGALAVAAERERLAVKD
jgi:glucokinase